MSADSPSDVSSWDRAQNGAEHNYVQHPTRRHRVDSWEIRHVGGRFPNVNEGEHDSYAPNIEVPVEPTVATSQAPDQQGSYPPPVSTQVPTVPSSYNERGSANLPLFWRWSTESQHQYPNSVHGHASRQGRRMTRSCRRPQFADVTEQASVSEERISTARSDTASYASRYERYQPSDTTIEGHEEGFQEEDEPDLDEFDEAQRRRTPSPPSSIQSREHAYELIHNYGPQPPFPYAPGYTLHDSDEAQHVVCNFDRSYERHEQH